MNIAEIINLILLLVLVGVTTFYAFQTKYLVDESVKTRKDFYSSVLYTKRLDAYRIIHANMESLISWIQRTLETTKMNEGYMHGIFSPEIRNFKSEVNAWLMLLPEGIRSPADQAVYYLSKKEKGREGPSQADIKHLKRYLQEFTTKAENELLAFDKNM